MASLYNERKGNPTNKHTHHKMASYFTMDNLKTSAVLALAFYVLAVFDVENKLATWLRSMIGAIGFIGDVDLPRAIALVGVAFLADMIRNILIGSVLQGVLF